MRRLEEIGFYDTKPIKLRPTWSNIRMGEERIEKTPDMFLV